MSSYSVTLYQNTGFNLDNIPDSSALLDKCNHYDVDAIWTYQDRILGTIRVKTDWNNVMSVDYCKINTTGQFYFVTGVIMLNPVTAELSLQLDAVTTIGLTNIKNNLVGGWCRRKCVADDTLFSNVIDEDFTPTEPIKSDTYFIEVPKNGMLVAVSTIDLDKIDHLCEVYSDSLENPSVNVAVPTVPAINSDYTKIRIIYGDLYVERELVGKRMYNLTRGGSDYITKYQKALRTVWSLGLQDAIAGIYYVPVGNLDSGFIGTINYFNGLSGTSEDENTAISLNYIQGVKFNTINFKWNTTVKNNKVFATRFNKLKLISVSSGNSADYLASEIYDSSDKAEFVVTIDPSENGTTRCKPKYIRGVNLDTTTNEFELFRDTVTGSNWISANINMPLPKGISKELTSLNAMSSRNVIDAILGVVTGSSLPNLNTMEYGRIHGRLAGQIPNNITAPGVSLAPYGSDIPVTSGVIGGYSDVYEPYRNRANIPSFTGLGNIFNTAKSYAYNKQAVNLQAGNSIQAPETWFPIDDNVSNYIGNSYYIVRERLSDNDTDRFDKYLTMYGYAVNKKLDSSDFSGRQYFNYIQCEGITLKQINQIPTYIVNQAISQLENGVRIWHTLVDVSAFNNNPIV